MTRRFWAWQDVVNWIDTNVPISQVSGDSKEAAVWWCCYRNTEALMDDTTRHIAQALLDGVGPFTLDDVEEMVQGWFNNAGDVGDRPGIDEGIEADLREFFLSGR